MLLCSACRHEPDYPGELDVPYVQTSATHVTAMLKLAQVTKGDYVVDLGCGDGRVVIAAAREFGAQGMGVDLSPDRIDEANRNASQAGVSSRVRFQVQDLFDADLRGATVVTFFLLPDVNSRLRQKLLTQLQPGARVVSYRFPVGGWPAEQAIQLGRIPVYLMRTPGNP
jgi:SAM-dependent methyltransferase